MDPFLVESFFYLKVDATNQRAFSLMVGHISGKYYYLLVIKTSNYITSRNVTSQKDQRAIRLISPKM